MTTRNSLARSTAREMALALWDAGYEFFPLPTGSKTTAGSGIRWRADWEACRFANRAAVADYWQENPGANIGIECEKSRLLVIDLDGLEAAEAFAQLWRDCEGTSDYGCPIVKTRRGWHLYFTLPGEPLLRNTESKLLPGVDTRGAGGMVVAPGSTVRFDSDGNLVSPVTYELESGDLANVPELPAGLEQRLRACQPVARDYAPVAPWPETHARLMLTEIPQRVAVALPGRRNRVLNREAWRMRPGLDVLGYETIYDALWSAAEQSGLAQEEHSKTVATIKSGLGC